MMQAQFKEILRAPFREVEPICYQPKHNGHEDSGYHKSVEKGLRAQLEVDNWCPLQGLFETAGPEEFLPANTSNHLE